MLKATMLFLLLLSVLSPAYAITDEDFKKLYPEPVLVLVENGKGSVEVLFAKKAGIAEPKTRITDAVGTNGTISGIRFDWEPPTSSTPPGLLVGKLSVNTQGFVDPTARYTGQIVFLWDNGESRVVEYSIQNPTSIGFDVSPEQSDISLAQWQPDGVVLRIKNTGKSRITNIIISTLGLQDTATGHRINPKAQPLQLDLDPGLEKEVTYLLPQPLRAGTYSGVLDVTADQTTRKPMQLVVRTRGPKLKGFPSLPFVLFILVLGLAFWLSQKLEDWFGEEGGLKRSRAILSLQSSQTTITEGQGKLEEWQKQYVPARVPRTEVRLQQLAADVATALKTAGDLPLNQLIDEAQRIASHVAAHTIFWSAIQIATKRYGSNPQDLSKVATALENVEIPEPLVLNSYRADLLKVLEAPPAERGRAIDGSRADTAVLSPVELRNKIRFMDWLYDLVVWFVVFITAYQTLYLTNKAFGTLLDYLVVFLWTLGLTQTGKNILARATSSYTPKPQE